MGSLICYTAKRMELKKPQKLVITGVREQARLIRAFDLRADGTVDFRPGQVAVLRVEGSPNPNSSDYPPRIVVESFNIVPSD